MSSDPGGNYTELDVGAQAGFWAGAIHNPTGHAPSGTRLLDCNSSGLSSSAEITASGWSAELYVPFALVQQELKETPSVWRANFYRTDKPEGSAVQEFSAWSPTMASPPNFHVPSRFGVLILCSADIVDSRCSGRGVRRPSLL
eukprot:TRINITY_DN3945_c0_g1_i2.p1 TRINITY_DN3945_c0_g1~~TRINITY_DN3945_c0_g1_i2.p1  ORF type:complete len:143 (-),score=20.57 TRINITY_DN3945_c0_g1_i2:341-769(-)